jgi:choline dehydrogenase-like flavoprotein
VRNVCDVLIVGSGPVGSAYARLIAESRPQTAITMVEVGPRLTEPPGVNVSNLSPKQRETAQLASQGPEAGDIESTVPGLYLLGSSAMPAAAMTSCVGGMGANWAGATPHPCQTERVPFIDDAAWETSAETAERLLRTKHDLFSESPGGQMIRRALADVFAPILPSDSQVQIPPLAVRPNDNGQILVTGVDDILGPIDGLLSRGGGRFELRSDTLCRSLNLSGERVTSAVLEHLPTGTKDTVGARVVVVAADSFRTPQLLWASGIRPEALGRHLMDHPRSVAEISLDEALVPSLTLEEEPRQLLSASVVPFADPQHPYQGGVSHSARTLSGERAPSPAGAAVLVWWGRTLARPENRVVFSDVEKDWCGMPALSIEFELARQDEDELAGGLRFLDAAASALGHYLPGRYPQTSPLGSSRHYEGTVRMGAHDDGNSVCDSRSRVWGISNLFAGGNGVIPTSTTCNPTLMSVALAARSVEEVLRTLD